MQKAIDDLMADFDKKLSDSDLVEIDAPEIPSTGGKIYCHPVATPHRKNNCTVAREKEGLLAFCVMVLINFALDAKGKHLFKIGNKDAMMKKIDGDVAERLSNEICSKIWGEDEEETPHAQEVAKKPSKETATS